MPANTTPVITKEESNTRACERMQRRRAGAILRDRVAPLDEALGNHPD
jgi:hypothetical protein